MLTLWISGKGGSVRRWVCYKTHFRGAYLFSVFGFCKNHLSFTSISFVWCSKNQDSTTGMLLQKGQISSSINHGYGKSCKLKIYASFRTLGLISVVIFKMFIFNPFSDYLYVCVKLIWCFPVRLWHSLLTILHTHKRCGLCLRKARVPDTDLIT